jgi:hypothetical protein
MYLGDEAEKWIRPNNYIDHWNNIKPTMVQEVELLELHLWVSTLNPLDKGVESFRR